MKPATYILICFLLYLTSCNGQKNDSSLKSRLSNIEVDSLIAKQSDLHNIPAIAISVFDTNSEFIYYYGVKDIIDRIPINANNRFHIGSCTKAITSFVAARLVEKNKINWDTKIIDAIPGINSSVNKYYLDKTLADLLSHRAGIKPFTSGMEFNEIPDSIKNNESANARQMFSQWLLKQKPSYSKNKGYNYSNAGYSIAASMLENASKMTWEELVQDEFFNVFNIIGFFGHPHLCDKQQPQGHIIPVEWGIKSSLDLIPIPDSLKYNLRLIEPAGDISLSIVDYTVFLQEILNGLLGNGTKLKQENYEYMFFNYSDYSMGWGNPKEQNMQYLSHDGSDGTFYCRILISKEKQYGFVIFANSGNQNTVKGLYEISGIINKEIKE